MVKIKGQKEHKSGMLKKNLKKSAFKKDKDPTVESIKKELWKKRQLG